MIIENTKKQKIADIMYSTHMLLAGMFLSATFVVQSGEMTSWEISLGAFALFSLVVSFMAKQRFDIQAKEERSNFQILCGLLRPVVEKIESLIISKASSIYHMIVSIYLNVSQTQTTGNQQTEIFVYGSTVDFSASPEGEKFLEKQDTLLSQGVTFKHISKPGYLEYLQKVAWLCDKHSNYDFHLHEEGSSHTIQLLYKPKPHPEIMIIPPEMAMREPMCLLVRQHEFVESCGRFFSQDFSHSVKLSSQQILYKAYLLEIKRYFVLTARMLKLLGEQFFCCDDEANNILWKFPSPSIIIRDREEYFRLTILTNMDFIDHFIYESLYSKIYVVFLWLEKHTSETKSCQIMSDFFLEGSEVFIESLKKVYPFDKIKTLSLKKLEKSLSKKKNAYLSLLDQLLQPEVFFAVAKDLQNEYKKVKYQTENFQTREKMWKNSLKRLWKQDFKSFTF